jgi:hypothetical protein
MILVLGLASACQQEPSGSDDEITPDLITAADSLAFRATEAAGGRGAWNRVPYLQFDFAVERDGARQLRNRHLWNKHTGDYRLERFLRGDSVQVVLFNVRTKDGSVFINAVEVDSSAGADALDRAYASFLNDVYWLAMPTKLFDEGVVRGVAADSSAQDVSMLTLSFTGVGLTPGDRYWVGVGDDGLITRWTYLLQNSDAPRTYGWMDYRTFETPSGTVRLSQRKQAGTFAILTDNIALPVEVDPAHFTSPRAMLD